MKFQNQVLSLHSDALPADTLLVQKLVGEERMSGLFRFELDILCEDPEVDLEAVLYAPAKLGIKVSVGIAGGQVGMATREIAGVFAEFEELEQGQGWTKYRAVLVPKLWQATRYFRSRVFQELTINEIASEVLEQDGVDPALDFEFQLSATHAPREYVVQYEETDWDFLARWLEHEGIYFYFVNDSGEEKVVFADSESAFTTSEFGSSFPYKPEAAGEGGDSDQSANDEIRTFHCRQTRLPKEVCVTDYNWRVPSAELHYCEDVLNDGERVGTGKQTQYNDHFKDEQQGKALARVRKEELACRARVFRGTGSCRGFRPGTTFTLEGHFRDDFNRSYVLTTVRHEAEQMLSLESASVTGVKYENSFEAVADDQPWRPERVTEWPSIKGVMNAKIDAEGDGQYAELDEYGRYKLKLPFDEHSGSADPGKASRWVRMAQPYAGENAGMHFPLLKGTEVLLVHVDGDPDRPVIVGAVPNPETESPSTGRNHTKNAIRTARGTIMEIDDDENSSGFFFQDARAGYVADMRWHTNKDRSEGSKKSSDGGNGGVPAAGNGGAMGDESTNDHRRVPERPPGFPALPPRPDRDRAATADSVPPPSSNEQINEPTPPAAAAPTASSGGALPTGGRGTGDDDKDAGLDSGVKSAFDTFVSGAALQDVRDGNKYRFRTASQGLSTWSQEKGPGSGSPTQSNETLNAAGIKSLLYVLTRTASNLSGNGPQAFNPSSSSDVDNVLREIRNFEGFAYGSRLRCWAGDDLMLRIGDNYTYADVSNEVKFGTGGFSWSEEHGDVNEESYHWGKLDSYSYHRGDEDVRTHRHGTWQHESYTYGAFTSLSIQFDAHASFTLTGSAHTETSVNLGIQNSNSVFLLGRADIDIYGGLGFKLDLALAALAEVKLAAATFNDVSIALNKNAIDLGFKTEFSAPDKKEYGVSELKAGLSRVAAWFTKKQAAVSDDDAAVSTGSAAVSDRRTSVSATDAAVSDTTTSASSSSMAASRNSVSMADTDTAALHSTQ